MEVPNSVLKYGFIAALVILLAAAIFMAVTKHSYDQQLAKLRNEVAGRDQTIEVQKGVFTKLSLETEGLKGVLNERDQEVKDLLAQVKRNKEEVLTANQLVLRWKKAYEGAVAAHQTEEPPATPEGPSRKKVEFKKDWGTIAVSGYTLTDPAEAFVKVEQLRALALTLILSQDANLAWHAYVTSNDQNTSVDISVSAVNPHVLEPRWYEKIGVQAVLAGGQASGGFGLLAGIGATYRIKQFDLGPMVFVSIGTGLGIYGGATLNWRPFER